MERIKNVVRISGSSVVCTKADNCPESRVLKTRSEIVQTPTKTKSFDVSGDVAMLRVDVCKIFSKMWCRTASLRPE
jgi:hypothetical protein